jgi:hypothetical protein
VRCRVLPGQALAALLPHMAPAGLAPSPTATPRVTVVGTAAPLYICWAPHSPQLYIHGNGRHYATWDASAGVW